MLLKDFAIESGIIVSRCDKDLGGTWAYSHKDYPDCAVCGFKTENAVYKAWLKDTFGENTAKAIIKLLKNQRKD